jgi:hypothetical protein
MFCVDCGRRVEIIVALKENKIRKILFSFSWLVNVCMCLYVCVSMSNFENEDAFCDPFWAYSLDLQEGGAAKTQNATVLFLRPSNPQEARNSVR